MPALAIIAATAVLMVASLVTGETDYGKMFDKTKWEQKLGVEFKNPGYFTK